MLNLPTLFVVQVLQLQWQQFFFFSITALPYAVAQRECTFNNDCFENETCKSGVCDGKCTTDEDCPEDSYCDIGGGFNVAGFCEQKYTCDSNADCSNPNPYCFNYPSGNFRKCVACQENSHCNGSPSGNVCGADSCYECISISDCGSGETCNETRKCELVEDGACSALPLTDTQCAEPIAWEVDGSIPEENIDASCIVRQTDTPTSIQSCSDYCWGNGQLECLKGQPASESDTSTTCELETGLKNKYKRYFGCENYSDLSQVCECGKTKCRATSEYRAKKGKDLKAREECKTLGESECESNEKCELTSSSTRLRLRRSRQLRGKQQSRNRKNGKERLLRLKRQSRRNDTKSRTKVSSTSSTRRTVVKPES